MSTRGDLTCRHQDTRHTVSCTTQAHKHTRPRPTRACVVLPWSRVDAPARLRTSGCGSEHSAVTHVLHEHACLSCDHLAFFRQTNRDEQEFAIALHSSTSWEEEEEVALAHMPHHARTSTMHGSCTHRELRTTTRLLHTKRNNKNKCVNRNNDTESPKKVQKIEIEYKQPRV